MSTDGSLAARHRPRRFADVAGQRHVVAVLKAASANRRPPHQILLAGPSGTGKTTLARLFAASLFCENAPDGDGCGVCESCRDVMSLGGGHPDVIEFDAASHGGVDQIRSLSSSAAVMPMRAPWRVFIIDEAHGLTGAGGQAFLRPLEEPPAHALFCLATTDPQKLPAALRGRCLQLEVLPPSAEDLRANLRRVADLEGWVVDEATLDAVLLASDPELGVRGTVMTLEKLEGVLDDDQPPTPAQLEEFLGVLDASLFNQVTAAIRDADRGVALRTLTQALARSPEGAVRAQLSSWARAELLSAVSSGQSETLPLWRYEQLVTASRGPAGLLLGVARASNPELGEGVGAVQALLEQARLKLADHASESAASGPLAAEVESPRPDGVKTPKRQRAESPGTGPAPEPDGEEIWRSLLNHTGRESGRSALLLRRCVHSYAAGTLLIELTGSLSEVDKTQLRDHLASAAAKAAITISVSG